MNQAEIYGKTELLLANFKNGKELFHTSSTFNRVVQMMVRGESAYDVIETLIKQTEDAQRAFEQHIIRGSENNLTNP